MLFWDTFHFSSEANVKTDGREQDRQTSKPGRPHSSFWVPPARKPAGFRRLTVPD